MSKIADRDYESLFGHIEKLEQLLKWLPPDANFNEYHL